MFHFFLLLFLLPFVVNKDVQMVTLPRPRRFRGETFTPRVGLAVVDPLAKSKECSFSHSRNIERVKKIKSLTWPRPRPFQGKFFTPGVNPVILDPFAKVEERSFIRCRNIEGVYNLQTDRYRAPCRYREPFPQSKYYLPRPLHGVAGKNRDKF